MTETVASIAMSAVEPAQKAEMRRVGVRRVRVDIRHVVAWRDVNPADASAQSERVRRAKRH